MAFQGNAGTLLASFLRNPGGGAAEVIADDGTKLGAGFLMMGVGLAGVFLAVLSTGAGAFGGSDLYFYIFEFFVLFAVFMLIFSFLGNAMGSEKSPQEAVLGAGACGMFLGITYFLMSITGQLFSSAFTRSFMGRGEPPIFIICLLVGLVLGYFMMMGTVTYGVWVHRFKTSGPVAGWLSAISVGLALALGTWLFIQMNGGERTLSRMF